MLNIMSSGERKLMKQIIMEKDERVKAVNDLTTQLESLRTEFHAAVSSLQMSLGRGTLTVPGPAAQSAAPPRSPGTRSPAGAPSSDLMAEVEAQKRAFEAHVRAYDAQAAQFNKSLSELRASHAKVDLACQSSRKDLDRLRADANGKAKSPPEQQRNSFGKAKPQADQQVCDEGQVNSVPSTSPWLSKGEEAKKLQDGGFDPEGFRALVRHTKGLEDHFVQQGGEITAIRTVLIEVHVNLLLHVMRASRIALRSNELSREERRLALTSLDIKERQLREDVDALRDKIETAPEQALAEIAKVTLEQTF